MSDTLHLDGLPSLSQQRRLALAQPKPRPQLDDAISKERADRVAWQACKAAVDVRDGPFCRCCKRRLRRMIALAADRWEHHHITSRRVRALANDERNVLCCCLSCHGELTRHELTIVGMPDQYFEFEGKRYLNADCELSFV